MLTLYRSVKKLLKKSLGMLSREKNCLNDIKCSSLNLWEDANTDITFWKYRLRAAINDHFHYRLIWRLFSRWIDNTAVCYTSEHCEQCRSMFPNSRWRPQNVLFHPQPKNVQLAVIKEQRFQKIITFEKLESEKFWSTSTSTSD